MSDRKTSPWVWVGLGCGVIIIGGVAFVAFIVFVVFASMRSAAPYQDGLARAKADPRVIEALGAPVEPGWFVSGNIHTSGRSGTCDLDIPLKGSKQKGSLHVVGTKEGGRWTYTRMLMTPTTGEPIDLTRSGSAAAVASGKGAGGAPEGSRWRARSAATGLRSSDLRPGRGGRERSSAPAGAASSASLFPVAARFALATGYRLASLRDVDSERRRSRISPYSRSSRVIRNSFE